MRMLFLRALLLSALLCLGVALPLRPAPDSEPLPTLVPTFSLSQNPPPPTTEVLPTHPPAALAPTGTPTQPSPDHYSVYLPRISSARPFVAQNIILLIGDGMGLEHVKAGGMYLNGAAGTLPFEQFPLHARMTTYSASSAVTDSAAAASAVATGQKVNNKVISEARPGSGEDLYTLLEYARDHGLSTGLVTTTPITDATPAGFGAHADSRENADEIASDYFHQSRPNVLFGGGHPAISTSMAQESGYTVVTNRDGLLGLDTETQSYVSGQFGSSYLPYEADGVGDLPHLSEMADTALKVLDNDPEGFFLMIEGGRIDTASHGQDTTRMLGEMSEFARTSQLLAEWVQAHPDTLIIVLADHETGGLQVAQNNGAGVVPGVTWSTTGHTASDVGVWISTNEPIQLPEQLDNTQIFRLLTSVIYR